MKKKRRWGRFEYRPHGRKISAACAGCVWNNRVHCGKDWCSRIGCVKEEEGGGCG